MYQPRYKVNASGRKSKLCSGKENKCTKEAKSGGTCTGCKTGFDRTVFGNHVEGEIFTDGRGIRYIYIGGQSRQLCVGDNKTCKSLREDGDNLCRGHQTGFKKYGTQGLSKNDVVTRNGEIRVFNGTQLIKLCSEHDCKIPSVKDGKCKKHSPHWHCRFVDEPCKNIRVDQTDYCNKHKDGVLNPRKKSKGEFRIAAHLDKLGIKYVSNQYIKYNDQGLYPDFEIADTGTVIEFDGKQHFDVVEYWGGQAFLDRQSACDLRKDAWIRDTGRYLLRISHKDIDNTEAIVDKYLNIIPSLERGTIVATDFQGYASRNYRAIERQVQA